MFKEIAIANRFGVGEVVDSYTLAMAFVMWIPAIWIAVVNSVYVPLSNNLPTASQRAFNNNLFSIVLFVSVLSILMIYLLITQGFPLLFKELTDNGLKTLTTIACGLLPIIMFGMINAHLSVLLLAKERHINTLASIVPSSILILFLFFWPENRPSTTLFIAGMLIGTCLQILMLAYFCKKDNLSIVPQFNELKKTTFLIKNAVGLMVVSQFIASIAPPVALYFAVSLGEGSVSIFGYATKIIALVIGLGATATGRAVLPVLSNSSQSFELKKKLTYRWSLILFSLGAIATVTLWLFAEDVVRIVFERGAFTTQNTLAVTELVRFGAFQFPLVFCNVVLAQYFASQQAYRILFYSSCLSLTVMYFSCRVLINYYELQGLMLARVAALVCVSLLFLYQMKRFECNEA